MTFGNTFWITVSSCIMLNFHVYSQEWINAKRTATSLSSVERKNKNCEISGTKVNCTNMHLQSIPSSLPLNVTILDLSNNYITELNRNLTNYKKLKKLYLRNNLIARFQKDCFKGLESLVHLDMQENRLAMNKVTFPFGVFKDLRSLQILKLNKNNPNVNDSELSYPDMALSDLKNLTTLYVDGLTNKQFGEGFKYIASLLNLIIIGGRYGYCEMERLQAGTFDHLSQLHVLQINFCFINGSLIDAFTFRPLKSLRTLDLSGDEFILFRYLAPALMNMRSEHLTHLIIHNIMSPYNPCAKVTNEFARSLPRGLTHITASSNGLAITEPEVFGLLPQNLTYLDISDNRFTFGCYLKNFSAMLSLETLILNGEVGSYNLPKWYPPLDDSFVDPHIQYYSHPAMEPVILKLPPKLKTVSMDTAGLTYDLSEFHVDPNNTLETLILNNNKILSLTGPITGLSKLKNLNLAESRNNHIDENFFDNFTSLECLNLSTNLLGSTGLRIGGKPLFRNLVNLKELDLSFTNSLTFDWNAFEGLDSLQKLHLQRNGMYYFTVNISHMRNLRFVNFSMNGLSLLYPSVTNGFDSIAENYNLSIDFSENPIHCYCANIDFIEWLTNSHNSIYFVNQNGYKCVYEDSSGKYFHDFVILHHILDRQCTIHITLFFTVTSVTIFTACAIAIALIYKFRWKLKYLYYSAYLYLKTKKTHEDHVDVFRFDVFVSFANEDEAFVHGTLMPELKARGLKVNIHSRDFIAGQYIATNIVHAIQSSRKTLIIVSRHLLKSTWCRFELQMANMESVHTGRMVMMFLLMKQLQKEVMDRELLYHIQSNTYMQLPQVMDDANAMGIFWTKLSSDIME